MNFFSKKRACLKSKSTILTRVVLAHRIIRWQSALFINFRSLEIVNIIEVPFIPEF